MLNKEFIARVSQKNGEIDIQGLSAHLEEVADNTSTFASKIGIKECGSLIGLFHDIGKASKEFQQYIQSATGLIDLDEDDFAGNFDKKGKVDHSTAGAQIIEQNSKGGIATQILSLCVASHHSGLIDCISPQGVDVYSKRIAKTEDKSHLHEIMSKLKEDYKKRLIQLPEIISQINGKIRELRAEQDSQQTFNFKIGLLVRFLFSCLIDADRLSAADHENPRLAKMRNNGNYESWPVLIERLENKLRCYDDAGINGIRQKISRECRDYACQPKGLYQLTVPTGGGKTLSSLRFALHHAKKHKMDRIVYVLPYTAIIDQNADEIRKVLEPREEDRDKIVLEHHSNLMPENESARQKVLSENWDAPVVLTTSVQVLEAFFAAGTRGARRMHQFANTVIIFDEVQALPVKCVHMLNSAINFMANNCGSTVVLCTATQPLLDKVEPKSRSLPIETDQQLVADVDRLFSVLRRTSIFDKRKPGGWLTEEIKTLVAKNLKSGSVLIVVNTKSQAREIYAQCKLIENAEIVHLSTNMCPAHRMAQLGCLKTLLGKKPVVCVSTQLIEAGVDISFGSVIRFLAGLDSIAQAAGRCNRHNEFCPAKGKVFIVNSAKEKLETLEDIRIGKEKAERVLDEYRENPVRFKRNLLGREAMRLYYQYYFYERADDMSYPVGAASTIGRADNLFELLSTNILSVQEYKRINGKSPAIPLRQAFMSANKAFQVIETAARGIIVPYGENGKSVINKLCSAPVLEIRLDLIRQAQRYSVNVFPNVLTKLDDHNALYEAQEGSGILCLKEQYYNDEYGLSEEPVSQMAFLNG